MNIQKHWYLGLIGLVGVWKFSDVWAVFAGESSNFWELSNLLWFLLFLHLVPETNEKGAE